MTCEDAKTLENAWMSAKSAHHRLDRLESEVNDLHKLTEAVAVTATNVSRLQKDVTEMKEDVKSLAGAPAKRWEAVIGYVMAALASGIVGVIVGAVFQ